MLPAPRVPHLAPPTRIRTCFSTGSTVFETRLKSLLRKPVVALLELAKTQRLLEQSLNNVIESLHNVVVGTKSPVRAGKFRLDCAPVLGSYLMSSPNCQMEDWFSEVRKLPCQELMVVCNPRGPLEKLILGLSKLV